MYKVKNVSFSYVKSGKLFENLDLELVSGRIYGLLGKNGTGKTTLIKLMSGLLKPQKGICNYLNKDISKRLPSSISELFIVPEEFELPSIKGVDYVKINAPFYKNFSKVEFNKHLDEFEIDAYKNLKSMSYGQKKKFLIAFALATNVKLLFLDEPTNGLDIPSKSQFRKIVARSLTEEQSIIISTHQARDLETLIDTVVVLEDGRVVFNQTCEAITQKLSFTKLKHIDNDSKVFYDEETMGGYKTVSVSKEHGETELDLELLFNAIVNGKQDINQIFDN